MTVGEAWQEGQRQLCALGIDEASFTAEVLLRHALGLSRAGFFAGRGSPLDDEALARYQGYLSERARGRPVAYILGRREFMGIEFSVDERVLIPRPETEVLVEALLDVMRDQPSPRIADVGTGSGAIAISVAVMRPDAEVVATDISADALDVARANARRHAVDERVTFLVGDLLDPLQPLASRGLRLHSVVCNPPYVSAEDARSLPREIVEFEPSCAVVAPGDGESVHRRLARDAPALLADRGWLLMEVAAGQAPRVVELLEATGLYEPPLTRRDALGWERLVAARLRPCHPSGWDAQDSS